MTFIAIIGLLILLGLAVFQAMLIFGRPLGDYAWGGQDRILPKKLRIASVFSIALYILFATFLANAAGIVNIIGNESILRVGMWVFTSYFMLGILLNAISRSKKERELMTPIASALALIFLITTLAL
ncbi:hypothetical protein A2707_02285 [Candidatus Saccharibacteria bacterium RIFCSPHIGHO2_01_FULL_45_15]|nr:MAG: hypothetical protein A2707_02285 [Candidatus Saccharibacteria bacterium RIFCSPHIGHO2_01_FULL_45_15]OGL28732.1 MAG: hypothetical protein A3C39_00120 [Candidatus Saccharibacteria bacterium RIFCSPHIGHO2_02_FULL_46_12]OGL32567.1 MAG: hypothetical protein A3E76_06435 [Candidatus Saccharibacteria bacterium RIFCSPHIGHO2_12_FULL_44_22]